MTSSEIALLIETAFHGVTLGTGISLRQAEAIDQSIFGVVVTAEAFARLKNQDIVDDWTALTVETIEDYCYLPHLDEQGFLYYIPAFMRSLLVPYGYTERIFSTLLMLRPKRERGEADFSRWHMDRYAMLDHQQCLAVAIFLREIGSIIELDYEESLMVEHALRHYWHRYL